MLRSLPFRSLVVALTLAVPLAAHAQQHQAPRADTRTSEQKIADAMSAAPPQIAREATIVDWPAASGGQMQQLRAGTNGWVCHPTNPAQVGVGGGRSPMCFDKQFQSWGAAYMSHGTPQLQGSGIAYMLAGDTGASNTDPYAAGPTSGNDWVVSGPHVMVLVPDASALSGMSTDPKSGGPWVMWPGTPYAHIMVPVASMPAPR